jgi:hypothetical protein
MTINLDEQARFGIRAFLQRCESRLATMHTIAGAFISGAGLLILLPVIYRDYATTILILMADSLENKRVALSFGLDWTTVRNWAPVLWILPILFSLMIPAYAVYLLVRELVLFYFVPHGYDPGSSRYFLPRFALSAISFPSDESFTVSEIEAAAAIEKKPFSEVKKAIVREWYQPEHIFYVIPKNMKLSERTDLVKIEKTLGPALAISKQREEIRNDIPSEIQTDAGHADLRAAMSGLMDRSLIQEAARLEATLTRLNYHLRRIVLRYMKALTAFIWTIIAVAVCLTFLRYAQEKWAAAEPSLYAHFRDLICLVIGLIWCTATPFVVSLPIYWIAKYRDLHSYSGEFRRDSGLIAFETTVFLFCVIGAIFAAGGLFVEVYSLGDAIGLMAFEEKLPFGLLVFCCAICIYISWRRWR